jgi:hypothetical protein
MKYCDYYSQMSYREFIEFAKRNDHSSNEITFNETTFETNDHE